jgi:hypothetical protein
MPKTVFMALLIVVALVATMTDVIAQDATPASDLTASDGCDVTPRDDADLDALNATATSHVATPVAVTPIDLPEGQPVDAATLNTLDHTLRQIIACAQSGDINRLLALYSDAYVATIALAPEPVPIVPGQPSEGMALPDGTPAAGSYAQPSVLDAVMLDDGRIAARVAANGIAGTDEIVFFVFQHERWVIDEIYPALPVGPVGGELPFAVQAAVASAAAEFGVDLSAVSVVSYDPQDWGDTSLGCPKEGEFYSQVITPGYLVILSVNGEQHEYHTDGVDRAIRCDQDA